MSSSILFVHGDEEVMEYVYKQYRFGYWSAAFDFILEKNGWLDFTKATQEVLENPEELKKNDMLIIAWLPPAFWKASYLRSLWEYEGLVFLEGPFPRFMEKFIGVEKAGYGKLLKGELHLSNGALKDYIREQFQEILLHQEKIPIEPKDVMTKHIPVGQQALCDIQGDLEENLHHIALSYVIAYKNRFVSQGQFFSEPFHDSLAALALLQALERSENAHPDLYEQINQVVQASMQSNLQASSKGKDLKPSERAILGMCFMKAALLLADKRYEEAARALVPSNIEADSLGPEGLSALLWDSLFVCSYSIGNSRPEDDVSTTILERLEENKMQRELSEVNLWLVAKIGNLTKSDPLLYFVQSQLGKKLDLTGGLGQLPLTERPIGSLQLIQLAMAYHEVGKLEESKAIMKSSIEHCFDFKTSRFRNVEIKDRRVIKSKGYLASPWVLVALLQHVPQLLHKGSITDELETTYDKDLINNWARQPYWIEKYKCVGSLEAAMLEDESGITYSALFRRGRVLGSSFQILAYIMSHHVVEPLREAFFKVNVPTRVIVIEPVLFGLLEQMIRNYCKIIPRIAPWPWHKQYCLTIRHDVDRIPTDEAFQRLLDYEAANELKTSWFWLSNRLSKAQIGRLEKNGHEIGVHFMKLSERQREIDRVASSLSTEKRIWGGFVHGSVEGWRGVLGSAKDAELGLLYSEHTATFRNYPYMLPVINETGLVRRLGSQGVVCLGPLAGVVGYARLRDEYARSAIDTAPSPDHDAADVIPLPMHPSLIEDIIKESARNGFHIMLTDHPDINFNALSHLVGLLPQDQRLGWTCAEVARWWHKTHYAENLRISKTCDKPHELNFGIVAELGITNLELVLPLPQDWYNSTSIKLLRNGGEIPCQHETFNDFLGKCLRIRLNLEAREPLNLKIHCQRLLKYEEIRKLIPDHLQRNTEPSYYLPRVTKLIQVINQYTPFKDLGGTSIVDVGCGYGFFTVLLYLEGKCRRALGLDISSSYVEDGNNLVKSAELPTGDVRFVQGDMAKLSNYCSDADIVIVNNSINFLTTPKAYKKAISDFHRVLQPGGALVILTPNRLHYREAFTQLIGVQFLPKALANRYVHFRGRRDTYADIRLPSPLELRRWLRKAGFIDIQVIDAYNFNTENWRRYFKPRFYMTATKPSRARDG